MGNIRGKKEERILDVGLNRNAKSRFTSLKLFQKRFLQKKKRKKKKERERERERKVRDDTQTTWFLKGGGRGGSTKKTRVFFFVAETVVRAGT